MTQPDLSVVFPVYNEEENIPILLREIAAALEGRGWTYEIVAVDDGSTDRSLEVLRAGRERYPMLRVLSFEKNSGQTAALDAAWRAAEGMLVVSLDADLQNDPADIPSMIQKLEETKSDMVIGVRVNRQDTWSRKMQSKIGNGVRNWITGDRVTDAACGIKAIRRDYWLRAPKFVGMHRFMASLVRWLGGTVVEVDVNHRPRAAGTAKYGIGNRMWKGLRDCFAMRWLRTRMLKHRVKEEF